MSNFRLIFSFLLPIAAFAPGCGGGNEATSDPVAPAAEVASTAGGETIAAPSAPRTQGQISRAELDLILDGGFGRFLQGVETQPDVVDGQFVGFRLASFYPDDPRFREIDLEPGDTVVRVNGQPIERPEQALRVWNSLRVASELVIELKRAGEPRELRFAIVQ